METKKYEDLVKVMIKTFANETNDKPTLSKEEQVQLLKAIASDADARRKYSESRAEVLLPQVDVQSTARKVFTPEVLAAGAQAYYPISFDYTEVAGYLPKLGGVVTRITEGDELYIPTFGIEAAVRYSIDIAEQGRVDVAAEQMRLLKNRIIAKEENAAWRTVRGVLSGSNSSQTVYCSGSTENFHSFSKKAVNKLLVQLDVQRRQLTDVFASPVSIGDIREWSNTTIDYLTQREIYQNGGLPGGQIWNVNLNKVYDSASVADSEAYGFDTRTYGKMPIQYELRTYEDPTAILQWQIGVMARERVGFGVTDSWAVVKAVLDSTHTGSACTSL